METKVQLKHPEGKKAIRVDKEKYDLLKRFLLKVLKANGELTHSEISQAIILDLKKNKIDFTGSVQWYLEWVKLDLEARKEIKRSKNKAGDKFTMTK